MEFSNGILGVIIATCPISRTNSTLSSLAFGNGLQDYVSLLIGLMLKHEVGRTSTITLSFAQELARLPRNGSETLGTCGASSLAEGISRCIEHHVIFD